MTDRTCTIEGCGKTLLARGWCSMHYRRWRKTGDPGAAESSFYRKPGLQCSVDGCEKEAATRRMCPMHYQRWRTRGNVGSSGRERMDHRGQVCAVEGCGQRRRHLEWCTSHYSQQRKTGEPPEPFKYKWAKAGTCKWCGVTVPAGTGYREFCGGTCRFRWVALNQGRPSTTACAICLGPIDLTEMTHSGRLRHANTTMHERCRQDVHKHGHSVEQLARRDGTACGICGLDVDMTLRRPSRWCASVDHIVPRALGGTNESDNVQLAHWICNSIKGHRVP